MKRYQFEIVSLLLLSGVIATAGPQEKPKRSGQESVYDELKKVPDKYSGKTNPLANDADAVAAGGVLFEEHCEECHGKEGMGGKKAPSLRAEEVQNASPGAIFWILTNGVVRKRMPVWSKLPEPERWQLVRYIKSLGIASARASQSGKP
ncbi:MAG: cytochrome c [Candidatus Acidiferrum sp.]